MIRRWVSGVLDAQGWADDVGELLQRIVLAILRPVPVVKDVLHGTWLGHALHPVVTDVAVGAMTAGIVLDVLAVTVDDIYVDGANVVTLVGYLGVVASAFSGFTDLTGTYGRDRRYATIHGLLMTVAAVLYAFSLLVRADVIGGTHANAFALAAVGYAIIAVSSYIGGEIVYRLGYMVDRHAWRNVGTRWQALEPSEFQEGRPSRARAGAQNVVVVRQGDALYVLHDTCAHAGCSLAEKGKLIGDKIECECHGSRYELATGKVARGPSTWDQPAYDVRRDMGKVEVRPRTKSP